MVMVDCCTFGLISPEGINEYASVIEVPLAVVVAFTEACVSMVMKEFQSNGVSGGGFCVVLLVVALTSVYGTLTGVGREGGGATGIGLAEFVGKMVPFILSPLV